MEENDNINEYKDLLKEEMDLSIEDELKVYTNVAQALQNFAKNKQIEACREVAKEIQIYINKNISIRDDRKHDKKVTATDIFLWIEEAHGIFYLHELDNDLQILTESDKNNRSQVLGRLCKKGIIERLSNKKYRKIDKSIKKIEWWKQRPQILDIHWPLAIEQYAEIYSKNTIMITGSDNAGKSAFCLRTALLNMDNFEIDYYSTEMADEEFGKRMELFDLTEEEKQRFINRVKVWGERSSHFEDIIDPNRFSIIDYLTTSGEKAFTMKDHIEAIDDKLKRGICLIAQHKQRGRESGYGGQRTQDRPRLIISLEHGACKLIKVKNWACEDNPNGKICFFKLYNGAKFQPVGIFHPLGADMKDMEYQKYMKNIFMQG